MENYSAGVFTGYTPISGSLPWGGGGGGAFSAANPQQLGQQYQNAYSSSLQQNKSNYDNIMAGYRQTLASQTANQQAITAGYSTLYNDVLAGIKGIGASRDTDIGNAAVANLGKGTQSLIDRGLGNTTVQDSMARAVESDKQRELTANANQVAGLTAQYGSQLGLAGLSARQGQVDRDTQLNLNQLGFMNSVNAGYPNAGMYGQLAQQFGQAGAADKNAKLIQQQSGAGLASGFTGSPGPRVGYTPAPVPSYGGGGGLDYSGGGGGGYNIFNDPSTYGGMYSGGGNGGFMSAYTGGGAYAGGGDYGSMLAAPVTGAASAIAAGVGGYGGYSGGWEGSAGAAGFDF